MENKEDGFLFTWGDKMLKEAIYHQPYDNYAYPVGEEKLYLQLRVKKNDLTKVYIIYDGRFRNWDQSPPRYKKELTKYSSDHLYDYYQVEIEYSTTKFRYFFLLDDGREQVYYTNYGLQTEKPDWKKCFEYTYIAEQDRFTTPEWVKNGVFYQIFPERFYNGDPNLNPEETTSWQQRKPEPNSFYGGDLPGIIEKLDYLEELGIDAIYLTPVFESGTNHKYNIIDYKQIDSNFGDLDTCKQLVEEAHQRDIKVIFDGVFNHTSDQFFAFQDLLANGKKSDYKDWYHIKDFPVKENPGINYNLLQELFSLLSNQEITTCEEFKEYGLPKLNITDELTKSTVKELTEHLLTNYVDNGPPVTIDVSKFREIMVEDPQLREILLPNYETFANQVWGMPKLNTSHPEVRDYILDVARYWIEEAGIDGWRLDVADEVDHDFWRQFRKTVKKADPEAYIVGEVWNDASAWLQGTEFDGVMNYLFTETVWDFFCRQKIDARELEHRLTIVRTRYKRQAQYASLNLVDSHDTERVLTIADKDKTRQKLVAAFQMSYVGSPMIYYGDEVGIKGGSDPDCRRPMIWEAEKQDQELFNWYQKLIAIRKQNPALRTGELEVLTADAVNNLYSFARYQGDNKLIVAFNNDNSSSKLTVNLAELEIKAEAATDLLSRQEYQIQNGQLQVTINKYSVVILKLRDNF